MVGLASNASQVLPATDRNFPNGWVPIGLATSVGFQVNIPSSVSGTISFEVTDDPQGPNAPAAVTGPTTVILVAPNLAPSTPSTVAVAYNFTFSDDQLAADYVRLRWTRTGGGAAADLNVRVFVREAKT
jgi:hypothetical protein